MVASGLKKPKVADLSLLFLPVADAAHGDGPKFSFSECLSVVDGSASWQSGFLQSSSAGTPHNFLLLSCVCWVACIQAKFFEILSWTQI